MSRGDHNSPSGDDHTTRSSGRSIMPKTRVGRALDHLQSRITNPSETSVGPVTTTPDHRGRNPPGSVRASGQARWIRAVEAHPDFASLRADALSNLLAIAWVLARSADWTSLTTRPTWPRVMRTAGIRRSTLAKDLRLLRDAGLLGVVETGSTPLFRPGVLHGLPRVGEGNRAAEYVLCVPCPPDSQDPCRAAVDETRTPSSFRKEAELRAPTRARRLPPPRTMDRHRYAQDPEGHACSGTGTPAALPAADPDHRAASAVAPPRVLAGGVDTR